MQIITTADGSHTLFSEQFNEIYHSRHGAIEESLHVFIKSGLNYVLQEHKDEVRIFEVGLGTGLNAMLTMLEADKREISIDYTAIELYPVDIDTIKALNYTQQLGYEYCFGPYHSLHLVRWNETHQITPHFVFKKIKESLLTQSLPLNTYHLIYFDAFAYTHQPEMWSVDVFKKMYDTLAPDGILVTYSSKVVIQKAMKEAGFTIEKIPGPPGRREMVRAHKK